MLLNILLRGANLGYSYSEVTLEQAVLPTTSTVAEVEAPSIWCEMCVYVQRTFLVRLHASFLLTYLFALPHRADGLFFSPRISRQNTAFLIHLPFAQTEPRLTEIRRGTC